MYPILFPQKTNHSFDAQVRHFLDQEDESVGIVPRARHAYVSMHCNPSKEVDAQEEACACIAFARARTKNKLDSFALWYIHSALLSMRCAFSCSSRISRNQHHIENKAVQTGGCLHSDTHLDMHPIDTVVADPASDK